MITDDTDLSRDVVFDLLSSPRRRYVIYYLRKNGGPVELTTLAEHVAAWENDTTVDRLDSQDRKRVYVSLYQTHVPRLAETGVVDYDRDSGEITLAAGAERIDPFIGGGEVSGDWYRYYLAAAAVSTAAFVGHLAGLPLLGAVGAPLLTVLVIAAFTVLTVLQYGQYRRRRNEIPEKLERRE